MQERAICAKGCVMAHMVIRIPMRAGLPECVFGRSIVRGSWPLHVDGSPGAA